MEHSLIMILSLHIVDLDFFNKTRTVALVSHEPSSSPHEIVRLLPNDNSDGGIPTSKGKFYIH